MGIRTRTLVPLLLLSVSANAASWYVDSAATGAADGTSWTDAWTHPTNIVWVGGGKVNAGDTIYISGGSTYKTYSLGPGQYIDTAAGTVSGQITFRVGQDSGHNGWVIIDGGSGWPEDGVRTHYLMQLRSYHTVDGSVNGQSRLMFANCYTNAYWDGASTVENRQLAGLRLSGAHYTRVLYCTFTNVNTGVYATDSTNTIVGWCDFQSIRGDAAVELWSTPLIGDGWDSHLVFSNTISLLTDEQYSELPRLNNGPDCISVHEGVSIFGNTLTTVFVPWQPCGQHQDMVQAICHAKPLYLKLYGNIFVDSGDSMTDFGVNAETPTWDNLPVENVRIYNNRYNWRTRTAGFNPTLRAYRGATMTYYKNVHIVNNLFADCDSAGRAIVSLISDSAGTDFGTNNILANNIFVNCGHATPTLTWRLGDTTDETNSVWTITNNIVVLTNQAQTVFEYRGTQYSVSEWTALDTSLRTNWPSFTAYTFQANSNNWHLLGTDAVARDNGASYTTLFTTDFDGLTRGTLWDIGPYEYTASNLVLHFTFADNFTNAGYVTDQSGNSHHAWLMDATNYPYRGSGPVNLGGYSWWGYTNGYMTDDPGDPTKFIKAQYAAITNITGIQFLTNGTISLWVWWGDYILNNNRWTSLLDCGYPPVYSASPTEATNSWTLQYGSPRLSESITGPVFKVYTGLEDADRPGEGDDNFSTNGIIARWTQAYTNTTWYHMAITWSTNGTCVAYQDGLPVMTNSVFTYPYLRIGGRDWLCIGAQQHDGTATWGDADDLPNSGYFRGKLADVRIYNTQLSAAEVAALYTAAPATTANRWQDVRFRGTTIFR